MKKQNFTLRLDPELVRRSRETASARGESWTSYVELLLQADSILHELETARGRPSMKTQVSAFLAELRRHIQEVSVLAERK